MILRIPAPRIFTTEMKPRFGIRSSMATICNALAENDYIKVGRKINWLLSFFKCSLIKTTGEGAEGKAAEVGAGMIAKDSRFPSRFRPTCSSARWLVRAINNVNFTSLCVFSFLSLPLSSRLFHPFLTENERERERERMGKEVTQAHDERVSLVCISFNLSISREEKLFPSAWNVVGLILNCQFCATPLFGVCFWLKFFLFALFNLLSVFFFKVALSVSLSLFLRAALERRKIFGWSWRVCPHNRLLPFPSCPSEPPPVLRECRTGAIQHQWVRERKFG